MYKQKQVKMTITIDPEVLEQLKEYLAKINSTKTMMHVSQSSFITEAVKQLLEVSNGLK